MIAPQAIAGTLESNDILVTISSGQRLENTVELESLVMLQFGPAIVAVIESCLDEAGMRGVHVSARDRGALDCTIRARMETAIARYQGVIS